MSKECTDEAIYGLGLKVSDAVTGKDVCDAVVTVTDGTYQETLELFSLTLDGGAPATCLYHGAIERAAHDGLRRRLTRARAW